MRLPRCPAVLLLAVLACQPYTKRPSFGPLPSAADAVVDLEIPKATELLAEALQSDSIPVNRVETRDGYLETDWFDARTGAVFTGRILGDSIVRVRGWVNAYGHARSSMRVETAVRLVANPSLPPRELDRQAPPDNTVAVRVARVLADMARRYPVPGAEPVSVTPPPVAPPDSTMVAPADSAGKPAGSKPVKPRPPGAP